MLRLWQGLLAEARREARFVRSNRVLLVILLALPTVYPGLISWLYSAKEAQARPVIVVDADNSTLSRGLVRDLEATRDLAIVARPASLDEATTAMRRQEADLLVYIPAEFSAKVKRGTQASLKVWANSANMYTYGLAYRALNDVVLETNQRLGALSMAAKGIPYESAPARVLPITWEERRLFHPTATYGAFLVPGVLIIVIQQLVLVGLGFSVGAQREGGLAHVERPATRLFGKALGQLGFYVLAAAFVAFVVFPLCGWPARSLGSIFVLLVALVIAMLPPAVLAARFLRDRVAAMQLLMFFSTPIFMVSGYAFPLWRMPLYVQGLAWIFPATPALHAMRILSVKTGSLAAVLPMVGVMALQAAVWGACTVVVLGLLAARERRVAAAAP